MIRVPSIGLFVRSTLFKLVAIVNDVMAWCVLIELIYYTFEAPFKVATLVRSAKFLYTHLLGCKFFTPPLSTFPDIGAGPTLFTFHSRPILYWVRDNLPLCHYLHTFHRGIYRHSHAHLQFLL